MQVEVARKSDDGLSRSVWSFYVLTGHGCGPLEIKLKRFTNEERRTRRHGWQVVSQWPHVRGKPTCEVPKFDPSIKIDVLADITTRAEFVGYGR
jgi:hypothetical protein